MKRIIRPAVYSEVRDKMQPGDLIAFGGQGAFSKLIKWWTKSRVSHVGVVAKIDEQGRIMVMESTSLDGFKGVQLNRLSRRVDEYNGEVWWYPLRESARKDLSLIAFWKFLWRQDGKKYDYWQVFKVAIPVYSKESERRMFCSELVYGAYEAGGIVRDANSSKMTPDDLTHEIIFAEEIYQIKFTD